MFVEQIENGLDLHGIAKYGSVKSATDGVGCQESSDKIKLLNSRRKNKYKRKRSKSKRGYLKENERNKLN